MNTFAMHPPEAVQIGTSKKPAGGVSRATVQRRSSGTGLRMIYELPDNARKLGPEESL